VSTASVLAAAALLAAATPPGDARPALPAVTVTAQALPAAPRVPASTTVIDADTIRRAGPQVDASEVLVRVPGVVAANRNNYAQDLQLSVRGYGSRATFGVRGVRLSVNGIPATAPDGQGQLSNAALASADRIEVVRGPLAALHGNGGGAIKVGVDPGAQAPGGRALVFADGDLRRYGALLRGATTSGGWLLDLGRFDTDGFRPQSSARRDLLDAIGAWTLDSGLRVSATANLLDSPFAQDPLGLTPAQFAADPDSTAPQALAFDTRKSTRQAQAGLALSFGEADGQGGSASLYGGRRAVEQFLAVPPAAQAAPTSGGGVIDLERAYGGAELRGWRSVAPGGRPLRLIVGLDLERLDEDRRGYENFVGATLGVQGRLRRDEDNAVTRVDALLQAEWEPIDGVVATAGLRHNRLRFASDDAFVAPGNPDDSGARRFTANVPAAGLRWSPDGPWSLHAAIARGFETPTTNELAYRADGASGFNLDLRPSRSVQREAGLRFDDGTTRIDAAVFHDDSTDEIAVARAQGGRSAFRNAGSAKRRGIEFSLERALADDWTLALAWTRLDARFDSGAPACETPPCPPGAQPVLPGNRLPALPGHFGFAELRWIPSPAWEASFELRGAGARFADDGNLQRAPGYVDASLGLARRFAVGDDTLELRLRLENLGDARYVSSVIVNDANGRVFEPAAGRRLLLGVGFDW
jgi:iron complex outermembrane receptor protein